MTKNKTKLTKDPFDNTVVALIDERHLYLSHREGGATIILKRKESKELAEWILEGVTE